MIINTKAQASTSNAFSAVMEEPGNVVTSTIRNIPRFDGAKQENYREWSSKTRVVLSMSNKDVFDVLNGSVEPVPAITDSDTPDTPTNLVEIQRWKRACETLFSVLYLATSGPAATLDQQYEDRTSAGGLGHGQKAWNALFTKYNSNSQEARPACYEKLVSFRMKKGQDPDDYIIKLMETQGRLHGMGEQIPDERFEDILLQGLTDDYEFVKMTSFYSPKFCANEIQSMTRNLYEVHRPTLETRTCKQASRQRSGNGNHQMIVEGTMLQLPRNRTHEARMQKQQGGAICYTKMVLATQLYDTQRCRVQRSERAAQRGQTTTVRSTNCSHSD